MKKSVLLSLVFMTANFAISNLAAQQVGPFVIGAGFIEYSGINDRLSSTIGQVIVPTLESQNKSITQGFHQPGYGIFVSTLNTRAASLLVKAYPNPFSEEINLDFGGAYFKDLQVNIFDVTGKQVSLLKFSNSAVTGEKAVIQTSTLPSGIYIIKVSTSDNTIFNDIKLTKI